MNGSDDKRGIRYSDSEAPRIEFPCQYPIKVMGEASVDFHTEVLNVVRRHAPAVCEDDVCVKPSAKGNYLSVTVTIEATGLEQLEILFSDLKGMAAVKLVL